jgi:hypothetical protein
MLGTQHLLDTHARHSCSTLGIWQGTGPCKALRRDSPRLVPIATALPAVPSARSLECRLALPPRTYCAWSQRVADLRKPMGQVVLDNLSREEQACVQQAQHSPQRATP